MSLEVCLYAYLVTVVLSLFAQLYYELREVYCYFTLGNLIKVIIISALPVVNIIWSIDCFTLICDEKLDFVIWKKK